MRDRIALEQLRQAITEDAQRPPGSWRTEEQLMAAALFALGEGDREPSRIGPDGVATALHYAVIVDAVRELFHLRSGGKP